MAEVVVVAVVTAKDGMRGQVEELAREVLIPATHAEEGCVLFALHRDARDPARLVIVERWRDADALGAHMQTAHLGSFREQVGEFTTGPAEVFVLDPIAMGEPDKGALGRNA